MNTAKDYCQIFESDGVTPTYNDEEKEFIKMIGTVIIGVLLVVATAFFVGYSIAKHKYFTDPVQYIETHQIDIT